MTEVETLSRRLLLGSGWGVTLYALCLIGLLLGPCAALYRWRRRGGGRADVWTHISPARVLFASALCVWGWIIVDPLHLNGTLSKVVVFEVGDVYEVEVTSLLKQTAFGSRFTPQRVEKWTLDALPLQWVLDAQARHQERLPIAREVSLLDDATCAADVSGSDGDSDDLTLAQPRLIQRRERGGEAQVCTLTWSKAGGDVMFALHVEGEGEEARALSALPVKSPRSPLWTVDLGDALGPSWMTPSYRVAHPQVRSGDQVCFWLIRAQESLSEVCVDARGGALRSAKVVF